MAARRSRPKVMRRDTAAATTAAVVLAWFVAMRLRRQAREWTAAAAFERHVRALHAHTTSPCPLDVAPGTMLGYPCGSFSLIEADLRAALTPLPRAEAVLDALRGAGGLGVAFEVRRELINFKKACLALFHDAQRLELALRRQTMFFFVDNPSRVAFHLAPHWDEYAAVATALERAR